MIWMLAPNLKQREIWKGAEAEMKGTIQKEMKMN